MSPTLELQGAIIARLKAAAAVMALVATRVYDEIPSLPTFPYISMGPADEIQNDADCIEVVDLTFQIDGWSRTVGFPEISRIADAVRASLHRYALTLTTNALVEIQHRQTQRFRDPDGQTLHAVMQFVATIEIK